MFKVLICRTGSRFANLSFHNRTSLRTFLSDAYKCTTSWNNRRNSSILQKVNLDELYYELEDKFGLNVKATAIDVDIYANCVDDADHLDSLADLLHKLRLSRETSNTLDSTSHAVIRLYHDNGEHEELLRILNDRINYGIFLDPFTANFLLDSYVKSKDYTSAAKVASMLMLQEDFSNPINKALSLHACLNYIKDPIPFEPPVEKPVEEAKPQGRKKKEEIRIRVKFIRNPFFDDHFDLRDGNLLVGKTLHMIGQNFGKNKLGNSCSVLGLVLHQKYEKACKFLEETKSMEVFEEAVTFVKDMLQKLEPTEADQTHVENLNALVNKLKGETGLYNHVEDLIKEAVKLQEPIDIAEQSKLHDEWIKTREDKLKEQLERFNRARRILEAENELKELEDEERKLWFFENEEQLDLDIEKKQVYYPKKWFGKKKKPRAIDQDYIPPEVQKQVS